MHTQILSVEDLQLPQNFIFNADGVLSPLAKVCGICSNCCYSDCTGGY